MRTKALLGLAALAVSAVSVMAQSNVYSLNVVGYVNKSFQNGAFVLVSNPLKNGGNTLNEILPNVPDNTQVWRWLVANQDLDVVTIPTYSAAQAKWIPNSTINDGEAFFVVGGADFTHTFVGEVRQGALTTALVGGSAFEAVGSQVPEGGNLATVLTGYAATDNDQVWTWNVANQDFNVADVSTYSQSQSKWIPDATIGVADGFFLVRAGGAVNWVRNFTVP